jgi:hypothetical protein
LVLVELADEAIQLCDKRIVITVEFHVCCEMPSKR